MEGEPGAVSLACLASPSRSRAQVHARADLRAWAADAQESLGFEVLPTVKGQRYVKARGDCLI